MPDRNKVMQALKCCSDLSGKSCAKCTYVTGDFCLGNGSPIGQLAHDALELLKDQKRRIKQLREMLGIFEGGEVDE